MSQEIPSDILIQIEQISCSYKDEWTVDPKIGFSKYLDLIKEEYRDALLRALTKIDVSLRLKAGQKVEAEDYSKFGTEAIGSVLNFLASGGNTKSQTIASDRESVKPISTGAQNRQIGPYKLLQQIGEGGMGTVWMAEQDKPVRRRVALKLIRTDLGSKEAIARFEAERQALAMMNHQNIAKVLDAGTTEEGSPYFVMELVQGIPINKYCDRNKLNPDSRLRLFLPVCKAIQHAHQKGIIHRDLKPSNVLIQMYEGEPVAKVIDFGLAKALQHQTKLTDKTMFTEFGKVVGTLQYMSPEQATMDALNVDTRSDVYSLGVMLYELLAGSTPIENETIQRNALLQVLQAIQDNEPPKPSQRLSSKGEGIFAISETRQITPVKLQQILQGELDWIVMKAIEKDRTRRYETVNDFAQDIANYLAGDTVHARPPSTYYQLQKFARKNKGIAALILAFVATLSIGLVSALIAWSFANWAKSSAMAANAKAVESANEALRQKSNAEQAQKQAEKTVDLLNSILRSPDPGVEGKDYLVVSALDNAIEQIQNQKMDKKSKVSLLNSIGLTYDNLGFNQKSADIFDQCREIHDSINDEYDLEDFIAINNYAYALSQKTSLQDIGSNDVKEAVSIFEQLISSIETYRGVSLEFKSILMRNHVSAKFGRPETLEAKAKLEIELDRIIAFQTQNIGSDHLQTQITRILKQVNDLVYSLGNSLGPPNFWKQLDELMSGSDENKQLDGRPKENIPKRFKSMTMPDSFKELQAEFENLLRLQELEAVTSPMAGADASLGQLGHSGFQRAIELISEASVELGALLEEVSRMNSSERSSRKEQIYRRANSICFAMQKSMAEAGDIDGVSPDLFRELKLLLSEELRSAGKFYEAIQELKKLEKQTQLESDKKLIWQRLGSIYYNISQFSDAVEYFKRAISGPINERDITDYENAMVVFELAKSLFQLEQYKEAEPWFDVAEECFEKNILDAPNDYFTVLDWSLNNQLELGQIDLAKRLWNRMFEFSLQDENQKYLEDMLDVSLKNSREIFNSTREPTYSYITTIEKILSRLNAATHPTLYWGYKQKLYQKFLALRMYKSALALLDELVVAEATKSWEVRNQWYRVRALLLFRYDLPEESLKDFNLISDDLNALPRINKAACHALIGQTDLAMAELSVARNEADASTDTIVVASLISAVLHMQVEQFQEAEKELLLLIDEREKLNPQFGFVSTLSLLGYTQLSPDFFLAKVYFSTLQNEKAVNTLHKAFRNAETWPELLPKDLSRYLLTAAVLCFESGENEVAESFLSRFFEIRKKDVFASLAADLMSKVLDSKYSVTSLAAVFDTSEKVLHLCEVGNSKDRHEFFEWIPSKLESIFELHIRENPKFNDSERKRCQDLLSRWKLHVEKIRSKRQLFEKTIRPWHSLRPIYSNTETRKANLGID